MADLPGKASNTVDFDLAAMVMLGRGVRAGVIVRNLREPEFDTLMDGVALTLERQARAGVAWHGESSIVAVDVDLLETQSVLGPRRHVAIGGEQWFANRRVAARAGFRLNTTENALPAGAAGRDCAAHVVDFCRRAGDARRLGPRSRVGNFTPLRILTLR